MQHLSLHFFCKINSHWLKPFIYSWRPVTKCIKTRKCGNDGQSKQQLIEIFVKFVLVLPLFTRQKKTHEEVSTIYAKEKTSTCMIYYVVKWMKKRLLTAPSFSSTCLFYCILSHFKIIRCIVETLIAFSTYFLLTSTSLASHLFLLGCLKLNQGLLLDQLRLA